MSIDANEREACAAYLEAKAAAAVAMIGGRGMTAELATHVGRIMAETARELRQGFHTDEGNDDDQKD